MNKSVHGATVDAAAPTPAATNPCPFLRALVAGAYIDGHAEPVSRVASLIAEAGAGSALDKRKAYVASTVVAAIANGLGPLSVLRNVADGVHADELRGGPLDKCGAGSRILDQRSEFTEAEFARLDQFAADFKCADGSGTERGLGLAQLRAMMDANFARAEGARRTIDRKLMDGEWPVLLKVMQRGEGDAAHLSLSELRTLFAHAKLPPRIGERIARFLRPPER